MGWGGVEFGGGGGGGRVMHVQEKQSASSKTSFPSSEQREVWTQAPSYVSITPAFKSFSCKIIFLLQILNIQSNTSPPESFQCPQRPSAILRRQAGCSCTNTPAEMICVIYHHHHNYIKSDINRSNYADHMSWSYLYCFLVEGDFCLLDLLHDDFKLRGEGQHNVSEKSRPHQNHRNHSARRTF